MFISGQYRGQMDAQLLIAIRVDHILGIPEIDWFNVIALIVSSSSSQNGIGGLRNLQNTKVWPWNKFNYYI